MQRVVPEDIEELRARADLVEVVSAHTNLKKTGRVMKGLCCFHQEKTPSLTVDPDKQLYYCHGCGEGGDVFSFLQKAEGLAFGEAAQRLADRHGIRLRFDRNEGPSGGSRTKLMEAVDDAADYFHDLLTKAPEAEGARKYLERRGFSSEDAGEWKLGFAPAGSDVLYRRLLDHKFTSAQIVDSGLALVTESGQHRDRFRGRVIFPVSELTGQVVGFGARALGEEQPKYLNSPETVLYRKAKILFGLDKAKSELVSKGFAIVTEGYTDVIALRKAGFSNVVATCGTALGEEHFALIKRFCEKVILAFDADAAGSVASERGFGLHSKIGLEVLVAPLPAGKDPADVALSEGGAASIKDVIEQSVPLMRFVLEKEIARHGVETPQGKDKAVKAAASLLRWEPSRVARSEHAFWVARRIGVAAEQVQLEIADNSRRTGRAVGPASVRLPGHFKVEREALALLLNSPSHRAHSAEVLNEDHFVEPSHRVVFSTLTEVARGALATNESTGGMTAVMDRLPDEESRRLTAELSLAPTITSNPEEVFVRLEVFRIERQIEAARAKLNRPGTRVDETEHDQVFEELMRLEAQRRKYEWVENQ